MGIIDEVRAAAEEALGQREGFFLITAEQRGSGEIIVEADNDLAPISLEEIIAITREIRETVGEELLGDYDLTVSSAGLTSPLRLPRQYRKYLGEPLIVLLKTGVKETGELKEAGEETITLEVLRKVKPEGKKRKVLLPELLVIPYSEIKSAVYDLKV